MVLLAGCANDNLATVSQVPGYDQCLYRSNLSRYGHITPECRPVTRTQLAMARRSIAYNRQQEISAFEASLYDASEARPSGRMACPTYCPPPMMIPPPTGPVYMPAPDEVIAPPVPLAPPPVAECPVGSPVIGKPGYVTSPYAPKAGYVDVSGMARGSQVKDPYSGRTFRIP